MSTPVLRSFALVITLMFMSCTYTAKVRSNKDSSVEMNFKRLYIVFYETDQLSKLQKCVGDSIRKRLESLGVSVKITLYKNDPLALSSGLNKDDIDAFGPDVFVFISPNGGQFLNGALVKLNLAVSCFVPDNKNALWKAEIISEYGSFFGVGSLDESEGYKLITQNLVEQMKKDHVIAF
ncbi:hypothetical protein JNL27_14255 [bacterium]|nr:hypothetical protein [bacterium]